MGQLKYKRRCIICSLAYGILGTLSSILLMPGVLLLIPVLIFNIIFIIQIKPAEQKIKIIGLELLITISTFVIFFIFWRIIIAIFINPSIG